MEVFIKLFVLFFTLGLLNTLIFGHKYLEHTIALHLQELVPHRGPAPLYSYPETDLPSGISS